VKKTRTLLTVSIMAVLLAVLIGFSCVMCLHDAFSLNEPALPLLAACAAAMAVAKAGASVSIPVRSDVEKQLTECFV